MSSATVPRVKVCGMTHEDDLAVAVDAGADAVGVVTDVPVDTPREVTTERAVELVAAVPPLVTSVLVTMPDDPASAVELARAVEPDAVQLHGDLSREAAATVAERVPTSVIKAVDADDPGLIAGYADAVDALLVDSADAEGGGGTGRTHDWDRTREAVTDLSTPVILAGGLTPDNVADAVRTVDPFGVDVASGVEVADAPDAGRRKNPDAVREFVANAKAAREVASP
jgi:phosphoribosylanthranilate isomerase